MRFPQCSATPACSCWCSLARDALQTQLWRLPARAPVKHKLWKHTAAVRTNAGLPRKPSPTGHAAVHGGARAGQRLSLAGECSKCGHSASANYRGSVLPLRTLVQPGAAVDTFNQTQRRPRSSKPHRNPHLGKPSQPGRLLAEPPAPGGAQATPWGLPEPAGSCHATGQQQPQPRQSPADPKASASGQQCWAWAAFRWGSYLRTRLGQPQIFERLAFPFSRFSLDRTGKGGVVVSLTSVNRMWLCPESPSSFSSAGDGSSHLDHCSPVAILIRTDCFPNMLSKSSLHIKQF